MTGIRDTIPLSELMYGFYGSDMLDGLFAKTNAPILTTTTGVHNAIFGPKVMLQANLNANGLGAMPKTGWTKSGFRALTAASASGGAGVGEGGAVPDTVKGTYAEVTVTAKQLAHSFDESTIMLNKAGKDDVLLWADIAEIEGQTFLNMINRDMFVDNDTLAGNNIESLDRIIGSYAEIAACGQTANDLDIYGLNRDGGATWADAYVSQNGNTDRTFTFSLLDSVFSGVRPYWDNNYYDGKFMLTGFDTLERMQQLGMSQLRFTQQDKVQFTVGDGVKTIKGADVGFDTSSYKGVPIVPDAYATADTISRIFLCDGNNLSMCWLQPIQYVETVDPLIAASHRKWGEYHAQGEIVCTRFKSQGKVRDLK